MIFPFTICPSPAPLPLYSVVPRPLPLFATGSTLRMRVISNLTPFPAYWDIISGLWLILKLSPVRDLACGRYINISISAGFRHHGVGWCAFIFYRQLRSVNQSDYCFYLGIG
jgi:hypothetical protein